MRVGARGLGLGARVPGTAAGSARLLRLVLAFAMLLGLGVPALASSTDPSLLPAMVATAPTAGNDDVLVAGAKLFGGPPPLTLGVADQRYLNALAKGRSLLPLRLKGESIIASGYGNNYGVTSNTGTAAFPVGQCRTLKVIKIGRAHV